MSMSLKTAMYNIWKPDFERKGIASVFKPVFTRYIGVEDQAEYPNILKTLKTRCDERQYAICFDGSIPMQAEFDIIMYVGNELKTMDITQLSTQDIVLFSDEQRNNIFLKALEQVVNIALKQETFYNESSRNDFILKLIVWTYSYIRPMQFDNQCCPKCIYYGDITTHEIYFLMMLYLMTFDVIYVNPLRDENWQVETLGISEVHKNAQIAQIETLEKKTINAQIIDREESITLQYEREVEETILNGTGAFRAWQFRDGDVKPIFIKQSIHDINAWAEPSRVRPNFKIEGKTVNVPNMFFQIDGVYNDMAEYSKLVTMLTTQPNSLVLTDGGNSLLGPGLSEDDKLKLTFCMLSDGTFDIKEIQKMPFYDWEKYRDALEDFILRKINCLFADNLFKKKFNQNETFDMISTIITMNPIIIKMADGFDYTDKVPKLVIFLDNEDFIDDRVLYMIGFIWELGFDIAIISPSGLISIDSVFELSRFNLVRLDQMVYDMTLEKAKKKISKKGLFGKLFG